LINLLTEPGFDDAPGPMDRDRRDIEHFGGLFYREPAKETEFYDPAL
jgi:hypothetical protein